MSFYEFLRSAPYMRLLLPFMVGIISGYFLKIPFNQHWIFYSLSAIGIFSLFFNIGTDYNRRWIWGLWFNAVVIFSGFTAYKVSVCQPFFTADTIVAKATIIENPLEKPSGHSLLVRLDAYCDNGKWQKADDKVLLTVQKRYSDDGLELNKCILFKGNLSEIRNFGNPYEFDYKTYMNRSGVYYRAYIDSTNWFITTTNPHFDIYIQALKIRNKILNYFRQLNLSPSAFAVISALTVGDKSYLDQELKSAYINSGTMHILAVSGMHVALLFWLLQQITRPLMLWKGGRYVRAIIGLAVIWMYALITGLTPSVVRASVMFSFLILGETSKRNVNIYNTLSASALLLLLINPQTLFDIGFQLSYMAVLSIVVFYKDIYNWFFVKNRILRYCWSMIAVSVAAQLLTLPLTLYYFHQFPNYFILSNIIALPLSTVILYGAIFAFLFIPFKFLWVYVGGILKGMVWLMNTALVWVEHLPGAVTNGIAVTAIMAISIFIAVIAIRIFIFNKKAVSVYVILICFIILLADVFVRSFRISRSSEMIVLNTSGPLVIFLREGYRSYVLTNDTTVNVERFIRPYNDALMLGLPKKVYIGSNARYAGPDFSFYKGFLLFRGQKSYVWERKPEFCKSVHVDLLIISKIRKQDVLEVPKYFSPDTVLIKSDVFKSIAIRLKNDYFAKRLPCELLNTHGSWVLPLPKKIDK